VFTLLCIFLPHVFCLCLCFCVSMSVVSIFIIEISVDHLLLVVFIEWTCQ